MKSLVSEMNSPETTTVVAGVDVQSETDLPEWYQARQDVDEVTTFAKAIRELPQATETTIGYENPYTGEWVETDRFNVIVEPNRPRRAGERRGIRRSVVPCAD